MRKTTVVLSVLLIALIVASVALAMPGDDTKRPRRTPDPKWWITCPPNAPGYELFKCMIFDARARRWMCAPCLPPPIETFPPEICDTCEVGS